VGRPKEVSTPAAPASPSKPDALAPANVKAKTPQAGAKPSSTAQAGAEAAAPAASAARVEKLEALRKEQADALSAYRALFRDAKTKEDQEKIAEANKEPDASKWATGYWALVDENPTDSVALDALTWLYQESPDKDDKDRALSLILKDHIASPKLGVFCDRFANDPSAPDDFLEQALAKNPNRDVQGHALYALAMRGQRSIDIVRTIKEQGADSSELKGMKAWLGEEHFAALAKLDVAAAQAATEKLLERVVAEYADVKYNSSTLGAAAKNDLHEMRDLSVGKVAPDIAAEDIHGTAFKLSDYRGKVVLLDFWGNW
jgi:hypothetical protein